MDQTIDAQPFLGQLGRRPVGARPVRRAVPARHGRDAGRCGPVALPYPDRGLPSGAGGCAGGASEAVVVGDPAGRRPEQTGRAVPFRAGAAASGLWRAGTGRRGDEGDARRHRRPAVREIRRRACPDHRTGGAGGRGIRDRRAGRRQGPDRQPGADHALAVPGGAFVAADRADPDDAGAGADADGAVRRRRGGHAEPGVGRVRGAVRRHRGRFRHPVLGPLSGVPVSRPAIPPPR